MHSLIPTSADICEQLVLTADSGARSVMTVPGQRSTTRRATAAHHVDDPRQISIHPASLMRNRSWRLHLLQPTRPRNTTFPAHKAHHSAVRGARHGRNTVITVQRCDHGAGSLRRIGTDTVDAARNGSPRKFWTSSPVESEAAQHALPGTAIMHATMLWTPDMQ